MKKIVFTFLLLILSFTISACDPTSTSISMNTNITQTSTNNTYIPVTFIEVVADFQEACQAAAITLTYNVFPTNATNQNYTVTMPTNTMLSFISGTNYHQVEVVGNPPSGTDISEVIITVVSDDNPLINNTVTIYIYSDSFSPPACQLN